MRRIRFLTAATLIALASAGPADAEHPGDQLDAVMTGKEESFQAIDRHAPPFELVDADGASVSLVDFTDRVVVLHFIYASCPDVCPLHADRIAEVQGMINQTPMKDRVQFISITTDPSNDTSDVLKAYGPAHGLDPVNWRFLTVGPNQPEDATRQLVQAYGHKFMETDEGLQVHGVVTHVIDRGGRWAGNFHGLAFDPLSLVLYVNGLINNHRKPIEESKPSLWQRIKEVFS